MSQQIIEDFRAGLDTRKFKLSAPAGTLTNLVNAHITPGGEIEKRKSFGRTTGLTGTFGLLALSNSLLVFGSATTPGGFPITTGGSVTINYQRLQHPAVLDGTFYDGTKHAMTAIVCATAFGGNPFAVATFADGRSFAYYNGTLLYDTTDGLILPHLDTNAKIATALAAAINRSSNYTATVNNTTVQISGTSGLSFSASLTLNPTTSSGTIATTKQNDPQPATDGVQATGQFTVIRGQSGGQMLGVTVNGVDITSLSTKSNVGGSAARTVSRARALTVVTLIYNTAHGLKAGDIIEVSAVGGTNYNGTFAVASVVDPVTITYDCGVSATEATTADTSGQIKTGGLNPLLVNGATNSIYPNLYVPWATSDEATAIVIARVVNAMTSYSGYNAVANGKHIILTASTAGASINDAAVGVKTGSSLCIDDCSFAFAGSAFVISGITVDGTAILAKAHPFPSVATASYALTSNVATITTGSDHGLSTGDIVLISGLTGTGIPLNGTWTVASVPTTKSFTFAKTNTNITLVSSAAGTVLIDSSASAFYARLVGDINSSQSLICAATDGKKLYLTRAKITTGQTQPDFLPGTESGKANAIVAVTTTGDVIVTTEGASNLLVKLSTTALVFTLASNGFGGTKAAIAGPVRCLVSGGTAPYTFKWVYVNGDSAFKIVTPDDSKTSFSFPPLPTTSLLNAKAAIVTHSASFICQVTDSKGQTGFSPFLTASAREVLRSTTR